MRRIVLLMNTDADDPEQQANVAVFLQALQQLGRTGGHNVRIETRWARGDTQEIRKHAADLATLAPDVIVATGTVAMGPLLQRPGSCRLCSAMSPTQSAPASSTVWRGGRRLIH